MGKSSSLDLRDRIVALVRSGVSRRATERRREWIEALYAASAWTPRIHR